MRAMMPASSVRRGGTLVSLAALLAALLLLRSASAQAPTATIGDPLERAPLAERVLRVGGDHDFPPYEMLGPEGQPQGFDVELFQAVAQVMELRVELELDAWDRVRERLERGELDAVVGMHYSPERDASLDFTTPYAQAHYAIFVRHGTQDLRDVEDLRGRAVVVQRGSIVHDMAAELGIDERLTTVPTAEEALRALAAGEQDAALLFRFQGLYLRQRLGLDNLAVVGRPLAPREYCFAVGEGDRELVDALNEGLAVVHATGRYRSIHDRWLGVLEPHRWSWRQTLRVMLWVAVPALVLLALAFAQASMLRRQVAQRTRELVDELSERKRAERALAQEHERLRVTLSSIADGVITTDREGRVELMNRVAELLTERPLGEAVGMPLDELLPLRDPARDRPLPSLFERVMGDAGQTVHEHTLRLERGAGPLVSLGAAPIRGGSGELMGVVVALRDITAQRRMEQELARAEKLESVGLLAGGIAHDFNNILTGVLGHVSLARQQLGAEAPALNHLDKAVGATRRAQGLTQQLLTFSSGGAPVRRLLHLEPLLREALGFALAGSGVRASTVIEPELWPVEADPGQLAQVLNNLLINATHAMPDGGELRTTVSKLRLESGHPAGLDAGPYLRLLFEDDGPGVPPEVAPHIFEPFFTTQSRGSGLGLATAYSISRQHGGWLGLGKGSLGGACFEWLLPASPGSIPEQRAPERGAEPGVGRVLVMDDEEVVREVIEAMLSTLGYEVVVVNHGAAAVAAYRDAAEQGRPFAAVIMDLTVPGGMGGVEAMATLLELDPQVRGIVSSGFSDDPVMAEPARYGFSGVVGKPYRLAELSSALVRVLAEEP